nr:histidine kinase [Vagococcus allomyrinae]
MIEEIDQLISQNYQAKILAQEIEFKALQAQLDPHFLYNTLDSINWLALNKEETEISQMVTSLAFLFKKKIDNSSTTTTIEDELDLINAYIAIQSIRFQHRFTFVPVILIDDLSQVIPKLIIQPLIENSFKYAVEKMSTPCLIQLKIFEKADCLIISVSDNGPGFSDHHLDLDANHGIGLKNIAARLTVKYQLETPLTIHSSPFNQTEVTLTIPLNDRSDSHEKNISC